MVHRLGDTNNMKGDYRVCATRVTTHCDEVVDRWPDVGAGCRCWGGGVVWSYGHVWRG
jgi:hypothetical protein